MRAGRGPQKTSAGHSLPTSALAIWHFDDLQKYGFNFKIRIYLAIVAKRLKLQRFNSTNHLPSVRERVNGRKNKHYKSTESRDTINKNKAVKIVYDHTMQKSTLRQKPRKLK